MKHTNSACRIAIDARFYRKSTAGVGRYTRGLIHNLQTVDQKNDYTAILTPEDYKEWPKENNLPNWHVEVLDIPIYSLAEQSELLKFLNKNNFDLVHFTMFNHPVRYNRPYVVTIHDLTMTLFPLRPLWHPRTWAYRYVMQHAASRAKHIIVPSQATKQDVMKLLGTKATSLSVTYEAVEPEFKPSENRANLELIKNKYDLTKPFLFFVNAWRPHKGLPDLIEAYRRVKQSLDIQLLIAGKPNESFPDVINAVESAKQEFSDILTPGFIPDEDMIALYQAATAFVFPSHYEGFGLGALEAISCGCPTIAAQNSSLPEVLGEAALFYPTGDIDALSQTIIHLLNNPALQQELQQKGLIQSSQFSFKKMAEETATVYQKIVSQ